jgi:hypothetical protein
MPYREPSTRDKFIGGVILVGLHIGTQAILEWAGGLAKGLRYGVVLACLPPSAIIGLVSSFYITQYIWNKGGKNYFDLTLGMILFPFFASTIGYTTLICLARYFN